MQRAIFPLCCLILLISTCKDLKRCDPVCPIISTIEPMRVASGESINIIGENFFFEESSAYMILINGVQVPFNHIFRISQDTIEVRIPEGTEQGQLTLTLSINGICEPIGNNSISLYYNCPSMDGLVLHLPFDNNNLHDLSEFGNDGSIISGNPLFGMNRHWIPEKAIFFDGTNDLIRIPHGDQIHFDWDESFSISFWIYYGPQPPTSDEQVLVRTAFTKWQHNSQNPYSYYFRIYHEGDTITKRGRFISGRWESEINCDDDDSFCKSQHRYDDADWHHIVFVKDGTNLAFFVDCELESTALDSLHFSSCASPSTYPLYIGGRFDPNGPPAYAFEGGIDDFRIYNRALSEIEIKCLCLE